MSILDDIILYKKEEVAEAKKRIPSALLEEAAGRAAPPAGFRRALERKITDGNFALIAEIKKASPSAGLIRKDFSPAAHALAYEQGGAACLSVLTDGPGFQGAPEHLQEVRRASTLPVLRKDFMIDPYQVAEARAWGADCILLIMACLDDVQARELLDTADHFGMDTLVEVHDRQETDRALKLEATLVGINNRDLRTFRTSLETTRRLAGMIPPSVLVVGESGITCRADMEYLGRYDVSAFLVGGSLMQQQDLAEATRTLLGSGTPARDATPRKSPARH